MNRAARILLVALLLTACVSRPPSSSPIHHVVVAWLKQPGDIAAREQLIRETRRLEAIPGVLSVSAGQVIGSDRSVVDSSFDVAIIFTLADRQALESYVDHPLHVEVLETTIRPLVARYRVYDFTE